MKRKIVKASLNLIGFISYGLAFIFANQACAFIVHERKKPEKLLK